MKTVKDILDWKGRDVWSVSPETSVLDALKLAAEKNIGALVVLEDGRLVGIFSERDYARKVVLKGRASRNTPVRDIMTEEVTCIAPEESVRQCMALMTAQRIRHLPVKSGEELKGIISIGDVVKAVISEQKEIIDQLENYITAR